MCISGGAFTQPEQRISILHPASKLAFGPRMVIDAKVVPQELQLQEFSIEILSPGLVTRSTGDAGGVGDGWMAEIILDL